MVQWEAGARERIGAWVAWRAQTGICSVSGLICLGAGRSSPHRPPPPAAATAATAAATAAAATAARVRCDPSCCSGFQRDVSNNCQPVNLTHKCTRNSTQQPPSRTGACLLASTLLCLVGRECPVGTQFP